MLMGPWSAARSSGNDWSKMAQLGSSSLLRDLSSSTKLAWAFSNGGSDRGPRSASGREHAKLLPEVLWVFLRLESEVTHTVLLLPYSLAQDKLRDQQEAE